MYHSLERDAFVNCYDDLGEDVALIEKAYLQQSLMSTRHYDYRGDGLIKLIQRNKDFLLSFVEALYSQSHTGSLSCNRIDGSFIWKVEGIEDVLYRVIDISIQREPYFGISTHFCNSFFRSSHSNLKERERAFLINYVTANHDNFQKMNIVVDIARHVRKDLFREYFAPLRIVKSGC